MSEEKTLKKPTRVYFEAVGTVEFKQEDYFPNATGKNNPNYTYSRLVFYLNQNEQKTRIGLMGGFSPNTKIYCMGKENNESIVVDFESRGNENIIEKVSELNLFRIGMNRKEVPKTKINEITNETEVVVNSDGTPVMTSVWNYRDFLSEFDFVTYLGTYLTNGSRVKINGEITFNMYDGKLQKNFKINRILFLTEDDKEKEHDRFTLKLETLVDKDSLEEAEPVIQNDNTKKVKIKTKIFHQVNKNKREIIPLDIYYTYHEEDEKIEKLKIDKFFKVSGNTIRKIGLNCTLFSGKVYNNDMKDSDLQLSPEVQEMIDLGITSLEEIRKNVKSFSNVKFVEEILFNNVIFSTKENEIIMNIDDNFYTLEDLQNLEIEEEINKKSNKNDKMTEYSDLLDEEDEEEIDDDDLPF